ncbi:MAG: transposase [Planctomycetaceae bacterium]
MEPLIPAAETQHGGRPRTLSMREVVNTILSLNHSGYQWGTCCRTTCCPRAASMTTLRSSATTAR